MGLDYFKMLVVDPLHEWDIGLIKRFITHLIRILFAVGRDKVNEFNNRFNQISPFGRDTIRAFGASVSELKKFAARDWEDMLQVTMGKLAMKWSTVNNTVAVHSSSVRGPASGAPQPTCSRLAICHVSHSRVVQVSSSY